MLWGQQISTMLHSIVEMTLRHCCVWWVSMSNPGTLIGRAQKEPNIYTHMGGCLQGGCAPIETSFHAWILSGHGKHLDWWGKTRESSVIWVTVIINELINSVTLCNYLINLDWWGKSRELQEGRCCVIIALTRHWHWVNDWTVNS